MKKSIRSRAQASVISNHEDLLVAICTAADKQLEKDKIMLLVEEKMRALKTDFIVKAEALEKEANDLVKKIQKYAIAHREELFAEKQSLTIAGHTLEFRKSPGRTAALKGYSVQDVVDALLVIEDEGLSEKLTTVKATLAKDAIMDHWDSGEEAQEFLRSIGIEVVRDEAFKFSPSSSGKTGGSIAGEKEAVSE